MTTIPHTSEGAALQGRGAPLTLADGRFVRVRYGMAGLVQIEEDFGSIMAVTSFLEGMTASGEKGAQPGKVFGPLVKLLAAGLVHMGITSRMLLELDLIEPDELQEVAGAVALAFADAFPKAAAKVAARGEAPAPSGAPDGESGTTSGPSSSDGPKQSSGT